ncbi:MAG: hypothetical protein ACREEW_03505, partial [Caulobacteraceae bacterium]
AYEAALGRAAFRTPMLLGGQAARAGVDCDSCHRSGRGDPEFDFPGVSDAAGTADVTSPEFSSHFAGADRGAVPIPDLAGPKSALKVSQDPTSGALEATIATIVTREFDGNAPPPAVLEGLAVYVRSLSPGACPKAASEPVTAGGDLAEVRATVKTAVAALGHGDGGSAALVIESARSQLGDIDERYAGAGLARQRATLERASLDLAGAEADTRRDVRAARADLVIWLADEPAWAAPVAAAAPASLYDPAKLASASAAFAAARRAKTDK